MTESDAIYFRSLLTVPNHEYRQEGWVSPSGNPFGPQSEFPVNTIVPELHIFADVANRKINIFWDNPSRGGDVVVCKDPVQNRLVPGDQCELNFDDLVLIMCAKTSPAIQILFLEPYFVYCREAVEEAKTSF